MNGIKFNSETLSVQFELEKRIKMFNIDKSIQYSKLKELIISIIGEKYFLDMIYPSPDSLPTSHTA